MTPAVLIDLYHAEVNGADKNPALHDWAQEGCMNLEKKPMQSQRTMTNILFYSFSTGGNFP